MTIQRHTLQQLLVAAIFGSVSSVAVAQTPSRPAVVDRGDAANEAPAEAITPPVRTTTPPANSAPRASSSSAAPTGASRPTMGASSNDEGPRVLTPADLAPDSGPINTNFASSFDPLNPPSNVRVNIDFDQAELSDVVMWISALTGQNFIIADTIASSKKITIISPQPVSTREAYRAFIAALNMNGLTVVPFGRFLKIVDAESAPRQANPISSNPSSIANDDRMVTHIHQLDHVAIATVLPVLEALKTTPASIITYEATNTLIITETGSNLRRLLDVIARLDTPGGREQIHIYQVRHAEAEDIKSILTELFQSSDQANAAAAQAAQAAPPRRPTPRTATQSAGATPSASAASPAETSSPSSVAYSQIIADARTNQLFVISTQRSFDQMMDVVRKLDVPIPGEGQIHVVRLENANATDLAATLQALAQGVEQQSNQGSGGQGGQGGRPGANQAAPTGGSGSTLSGSISVNADESTNSLVVVASLRDFLTLQSVIKQLDRRREQVYVEAVIMEISLDRTSEFGIALNGGALTELGGQQTPLYGMTSLGSLSSVFIDPTSLMGLAVGLRGPSVEGTSELFGISLPSFGAILQAVQTDSDVNVLSTPHILTMDNEEAEIIVGENVPFVTSVGSNMNSSLTSLLAGSGLSGSGGLGDLGSLGGLGGLLGNQVSIQRQDVALTLRITPQINSSNYVRLQIEQQIDDIASDDPVRGPTTTTRQIRTTVAVEDQQTVVLGGLMRDTQTRTVNKVPFLGDIPVLGHLFRNTSSRTVKTNLLLLLTPYIIRDPSDFQEIFRRKMQEREEFLAYFGRRTTDYVRSVDYARKNGPAQSMLQTIATSVDSERQRALAFGTESSETVIDLGDSSTPIRVDVDAAAE